MGGGKIVQGFFTRDTDKRWISEHSMKIMKDLYKKIRLFL